MTRLPSEEEFAAWKLDPVTQYVCEMLAAKREELRQQWEGGSFTDWEPKAMALTNVGNIGTCRGYAFIQELSYDDLVTEREVDDGKPKRA